MQCRFCWPFYDDDDDDDDDDGDVDVDGDGDGDGDGDDVHSLYTQDIRPGL